MLNIVIPMAGRGSRFASAGFTDPKPLITIGEKRMIELVVENLTPRVPHRFIFICQKAHLDQYNYQPKLQAIAKGSEIITIDGVTEGAACTVMWAKDWIDNENPLMIANSDQWVDVDIDRYLKEMDVNHLDGLIMTMKSNDPKWSFVEFNERGTVKNVVEKEVVSNEATVGIYNFRHGSDFCKHAKFMIESDERSNGEFYVAPVYTYLYKIDNAKIGVYNVGEEANGMYGLGTPADLDLFKSIFCSLQSPVRR